VPLGLVKSGNDGVCARDEYPTVAQKKTGKSRAILHRTKAILREIAPFIGNRMFRSEQKNRHFQYYSVQHAVIRKSLTAAACVSKKTSIL
jgi:hypothetical protein